MLRVVENLKPQSRPEIIDDSAKLESVKKEGNPEFEPLVIARPTELIKGCFHVLILHAKN